MTSRPGPADGAAVEPLDVAYRRAWPRLLAQLVRAGGRVELAEDCLQEAATRALSAGELRDPVAWIATTARRLVIDAGRREAVHERTLRFVAAPPSAPSGPSTGDDRLDLLILACHPVLPSGSRMPLALRFVLGTPTEAIADAFLVEHAAMSARLTRAKRRLDHHGRRFDPPQPAQRRDVLDVIAVLYTLGHTAVGGDELGRDEDRTTALELAQASRRAWPDEPEATALLALLLLTDGRHRGRLDATGRPTTLRDADRSTWDRAAIDAGLALATTVLPTMGRYALQAGIAGLHSSAPRWEATDWPAIGCLYDRLVERWTSPGAAIARAVAIGYGPAGPAAGLTALDDVGRGRSGAGALTRQLAMARADLLRHAGRTHEARAAYREALALERNTVVRRSLDQRLGELDV